MYEYDAKVLRVIDGDTVELEVDCGFRLKFRDRFRLASINAPELNEEGGAAAADGLREMLGTLPRPVRVRTTKPDKYGRWLAELLVYAPSVEGGYLSLNECMVQLGHAAPYTTK